MARARAVRRTALGGIVGPVAFVAAWLATGSVAAGYSALHDPISDLAAVHASTRITMTAGFIVYALGVGAYAWALSATGLVRAGIAAAVTAAATLGVAAFPLHHSSVIDKVHGACAATGYVSLAATALLAAVHLARSGLRGWAGAATALGALTAIALSLTLVVSDVGFFQRLGLTAGDIWLVASAVAIRRGGWGALTPPPDGGA